MATNNVAVTGTTNPGAAMRRLAELAGQAGANLFERARLSSELLDNREWLQAKYQGDFSLAVEKLQELYFRDIGGLMGLGRLRDIYRSFPNEATWKEQKYDLKILFDDWKKLQPAPAKGPGRERITKAEFEKKAEEIKDLQYHARSKDQRIAELAVEVEQLKLVNAELRGRIAELEKVRRAVA